MPNIINGTIGTDILTGTANEDSIDGFDGADTLVGLGGNDALNGGVGADVMIGGIGDDKYWVDDAGDVVTELSGEGNDWVHSSISYTLGANVEYLSLIGNAAINGTGNDLDNTISGNSAVNVLTGGAGDDTLDGMGGADTMVGGTGDDRYFVNDASDVVTENAGEGEDHVYSSVSYALTANVERLLLMGNAIAGFGNDLDNVIAGNDANNVLKGGGGDDWLVGGAGADSLYGGLGDDTYHVDQADTVVEYDGGGIDRVFASFSYTLGANVENLQLLDSAANGTGNNLDNDIYGNNVGNMLTGGAGDDYLQANHYNAPGGDGFGDKLFGGTGDDTFRVFEANDLVFENANEGIDEVISSFSYTLGANLENLTLANSGAINGTGNGADNTITGNCYANILSGLGGNDVIIGGFGTDTLIGGAGADYFTWSDPAHAGLTTNAADVIADFSFAAGDRIDLHEIDANVYAGGDQAFTFIGTAAFSGTPGEIRYYHSGGDTFIEIQTGMSVDVEGIIRIGGIHTPDANWFVL